MGDALAKTVNRACEPSPSCTRAEKAWASAIRQKNLSGNKKDGTKDLPGRVPNNFSPNSQDAYFSWWLSHSIWKICSSNWIISPSETTTQYCKILCIDQCLGKKIRPASRVYSQADLWMIRGLAMQRVGLGLRLMPLIGHPANSKDQSIACTGFQDFRPESCCKQELHLQKAPSLPVCFWCFCVCSSWLHTRHVYK